MIDSQPVRIGMVSFINTAPIYETWQKTVHRPQWKVIAAPPSELNRMLYNNQLELGCVSSFEYAVHPQKYRILDNLSISASGPVGSVFLFSRVAAAELHGRTVLLSAQSQTSVSLVKIILEEFYKVQPHYITGNIFEKINSHEHIDAVLSIGDEALKLNSEKVYPRQIDLGEVWHHQTGLPFVFALWTVQEKFCTENPGIVREIHHELVRCLAEGRSNLEEICQQVAPRIPMGVDECYHYLQSMEYDLDATKQAALKQFFDYLIARQEILPGALPLKIFS
jgi:chorismate dehydratase